ncbi:MAG: DUF378 domain-containing protein [Parcubacteria group bacterium]|nr:DUF378 domain-containing protein [Parcubacteria group bacterium]
MSKKCGGWWIAEVILIIGGLNWGLVGFFEYNLVTELFGSWPVVERVIYAIVGLAALVSLVHLFGKCRACVGEWKEAAESAVPKM